MNAALKKAQEVNRRRRANGEKIIPKTPLEQVRDNPKSLRKRINAKCWTCVCYQKVEVDRCGCPDCPLYDVRPWQKKP